MIDLRMHSQAVIVFLRTGLAEFRQQHPDICPLHVALYCCPWSGWISLCLDRNVQPEQNCPDFEFSEFSIYDTTDWAAKYEDESLLRIVGTHRTECTVDLEVDDDEAFNRPFFDFLCELLSGDDARAAIMASGLQPSHLGVQMLDSEYSVCWQRDDLLRQ